MGVFAALGGGRTQRRAGLLAAWSLAAAFAACLPRDPLASYSSSFGGTSGAVSNPPTLEPTPPDAGGPAPLGQAGSEGNPNMLPLNTGGDGSGTADASTALGDAAPELDAAVPPEADAAADAGPAGECARSQGTLEAGSNVCVFVAAAARVNWMAAVLACQSRNSTLVSIETPARNDFLTPLIATDVWVGGNDPGTNPATNAFVWRDGSTVGGFGWAAMEPDAVADQFCVAKDPLGTWHDRPCSELKAYVCEQQL